MINLIKIEKYGIIMLIYEKDFDNFKLDGWELYNGSLEPSASCEGD